MKNFIANVPIYISLLFKTLSDFFAMISFKLHVSFKTPTGIKMLELQKATKELIESMKRERQLVQQQTNSGDRKLVDIINGGNNGRPTFPTSGFVNKKPTNN